MSSKQKRRRSKPKTTSGERYITKKFKDKEGNVIVKRFKRKSASISLDIPWNRVPTFFLGSLLLIYAYIVNLHNKNILSTNLFLGNIGQNLQIILDSLQGMAALFLTGFLAIGIATFLGYALITKGLKIRKWGTAAQQLIAIVAGVLLFTSLFSGLINERGITRHQDDPSNVSDDYDVSDLTSPFYSDLIDGLLNMIGDIPDPQTIVATITPGDNVVSFDPDNDTYLWRWSVAESYGPPEYDYKKGYEEVKNSFSDANPSNFPSYRHFQVSQQYLTPLTTFEGEIISPWNSIYGAPVVASGTPTGTINNSESGQIVGTFDNFRDINQAPYIGVSFNEPGTQGYIDHEAYYVPEEKDQVTQNSITYYELLDGISQGTLLSSADPSRWGGVSDNGGLSEIWGVQSLPNDESYADGNTNFQNEYTEIFNLYDNPQATVYEILLDVNNRIQNDIIDLFVNNPDSLNLSSESAVESSADEGEDKAYYYYDQKATGGAFGITDAIAGFVNMLRALDIPARPVLGFAVGDVSSSEIEIRKEHIHMWVEALIPWMDESNNMQLSWAAFNPMPAFFKLTNDDQIIYGKNSYGGTPEVSLSFTSGGEQESLPSGVSVGGESTYTLAKMGTRLNGSTNVLLDGDPAANQRVHLELLDETTINQLAAGTIEPQPGLGIDLGTMETDSTGESNFSILVATDGSVTMTWDYNGTTLPIATTIGQVDVLAAEGDRNIYGLLARTGTNVDYEGVAWDLNGTVSIDITNHQRVEINDPGLFGGQSTNATFVVAQDSIIADLEFVSPEGDPIEGKTINLLFMSVADYQSIDFTDPNILTNYQIAISNETDASGQTTATIPSLADAGVSVTSGEYYVLIAFVSPEIIAEYVIHIPDTTFDPATDTEVDIKINSTIGVSSVFVYGDTTSLDVYDSVNMTLTDSQLDQFSGSSVPYRALNNVDLLYYLVDNNTLDSYSYNFHQVLSNSECTTDLNAGSQCYQLPFVSSGFGVRNGSVSNFGSVTHIVLTGGVIDSGVYHLIVYDNIYSTYNYTLNEKIYVTTAPAPFSIDNDPASFQISEYSRSSTEENSSNLNWGLYLVGVIIILIKISKLSKEELL